MAMGQKGLCAESDLNGQSKGRCMWNWATTQFDFLQEIIVFLHFKELAVDRGKAGYIVKSLRRLLKCGGALREVTAQTAWAANGKLK